MIAYLNLRYLHDARAQLYRAGLKACGYQVIHGLTHSPHENDVLVTWNRIGAADQAANAFQMAGCPVIVTENASWGNAFAGFDWYHLALNWHNLSNCFPIGDEDRWNALNIELKPWRASGETVILMQRGIGSPPHAAPVGWHRGLDGRMRHHPGQRTDGLSLEDDLAEAGAVITWGSGAAIKALIMGIAVRSLLPGWIGAQDNTDAGRLAMFQRLAWAQFKHAEIASGFAFDLLIKAHHA